MKTRLLTFFAALLFTTSWAAAQGPSYADKKTERLIKKMIKAHGGYDKWKNAPSMSFHHVMKGRNLEWVSDEIHQQGSRKSHLTWHDGSTLGFDGQNVWSKDWKIANPAGMMAGVAYFFLNIPWITQDDGVQLKQIEDAEVKYIEEGKSYYTVHMTYRGASEYEYYDLYIDKKDYLLKGMKYTMVDKDLMKTFNMPASTKFMGPLLKVYKEYSDVNGLKLPTLYNTHALPQGGAIMGVHEVSNYSLTQAFDETKSKKPVGGVIFQSLNKR